MRNADVARAAAGVAAAEVIEAVGVSAAVVVDDVVVTADLVAAAGYRAEEDGLRVEGVALGILVVAAVDELGMVVGTVVVDGSTLVLKLWDGRGVEVFKRVDAGIIEAGVVSIACGINGSGRDSL